MIRLRMPAVVLVIAASMAACSPQMNWRDVHAEGTDLSAVFPCRPDRHARRVWLAGATASMHMYVCAAGDVTFALSVVEVDNPSRVGPALAQLRALAVDNIGGTQPQMQALQVPGMTPNPESVRLRVAGRLPDAAPVHLQAALFSKGLRVFQATVIGAALTEEATQPFFSGLKLSA